MTVDECVIIRVDLFYAIMGTVAREIMKSE